MEQITKHSSSTMAATEDTEKVSMNGADRQTLHLQESTTNQGQPPARIAQVEELPINYYASKLFLGSYAVGTPFQRHLVHVLTFLLGHLSQCCRGYSGFCDDFSSADHHQHGAGARSKCCMGWIHVLACMYVSLYAWAAWYAKTYSTVRSNFVPDDWPFGRSLWTTVRISVFYLVYVLTQDQISVHRGQFPCTHWGYHWCGCEIHQYPHRSHDHHRPGKFHSNQLSDRTRRVGSSWQALWFHGHHICNYHPVGRVWSRLRPNLSRAHGAGMEILLLSDRGYQRRGNDPLHTILLPTRVRRY